MLWNKRNGNIVDVNKEQDVYFEESEELRDIEREYVFLFDAVTDLHGDNLLSYEPWTSMLLMITSLSSMSSKSVILFMYPPPLIFLSKKHHKRRRKRRE